MIRLGNMARYFFEAVILGRDIRSNIPSNIPLEKSAW